MKVVTKTALLIKTDAGDIGIPKGTNGYARGVSNSKLIKAQYTVQDLQLDDWFYMCCFPGYVDDTACNLSQIEILS